MRFNSTVRGGIYGVGGGVCLGLVALWFFTSAAPIESSIRNETNSPDTTSTNQQLLDFYSLTENSEPTNLIDRNLELVQYFETATFDQILELFNRTIDQSNSFSIQYFQDSIIEHLASIDPRSTLDKVQSLDPSRRHELIPVLYAVWAVRAPKDALRSAAQQSKHTQLLSIRAIVSNLPIPLPSDLLELSESLDVDGLVNEVITEFAAKELMQTNPKAAFELIFSDGVNDVRQESLLSAVIESWMFEPDEEDFSLLFNSFCNEYAKVDRSNSRANLMFSNLLDQMVQVAPSRFWQINLNSPSDLQSLINFHLVRAWGHLDPQTALFAISETEGSKFYEESLSMVWSMWAEVEPMYTIQNIQQVQPELRETVIGVSVLNLVRQDSVDLALSSISQLKDQGENVSLAVRFLANAWVERDAPAATDWLVTTDTISDTLRDDVLNTFLPVLANTDSKRAFQLAVEYGDPETFDPRFTLEMRVLDSIAKRGAFDEAKKLLQQVDESLKPTAFSTIGLSLISYGKIDEVIALGKEISDKDQTEYFASLAGRWYRWKPDELFENIWNLPTVKSQTAVAQVLLNDRFGYTSEMSQDEISLLKSLVADLDNP